MHILIQEGSGWGLMRSTVVHEWSLPSPNPLSCPLIERTQEIVCNLNPNFEINLLEELKARLFSKAQHFCKNKYVWSKWGLTNKNLQNNFTSIYFGPKCRCYVNLYKFYPVGPSFWANFWSNHKHRYFFKPICWVQVHTPLGCENVNWHAC